MLFAGESNDFDYSLDHVVTEIEQESNQNGHLLLSELILLTDIIYQNQVYRGFYSSYTSDTDEHGMLYFIGSQGRNTIYRNPHTAGYIHASMSSCYHGQAFNIVARTAEHAPNYTDNLDKSWIEVDFGPRRLILPDYYTIRHGAASRGNALRNWVLQGKLNTTTNNNNTTGTVGTDGETKRLSLSDHNVSRSSIGSVAPPFRDDDDKGVDKTDKGWVTLQIHTEDDSLSDEPGSTASWPVDIPPDLMDTYDTIGFRALRVKMTGHNSGGNNCLFCCGLEFYGVLFEKVVYMELDA